ncbi:hypothetical protein [Kribbella sp. NPDC055071]
MTLTWLWDRQKRNYGNFGNANQWTVNAGLSSLARESAQNTNDARREDGPAELVYTFVRLVGDQRREFETAVGWNAGLSKHLAAMGDAAGGAVAAGQIKAGLEALDDSKALLLLKISDYGCHGLTGPEFAGDGLTPDDYGNFIKLCRLDLFSGKDKAAGGSFGLGKAVYWRFSRLQTVLFNSVLDETSAVAGRTENRVFGVNQGVDHHIDGQGYIGRGYFGIPDEDDVASFWDTDAEVIEPLHLARVDSRPGTTALLVGFYDPDEPDKGLGGGAELIDLAKELRRGVEESFWPLLTRGRLRVKIQVFDNGLIYNEEIDPGDTFTELVRALQRFDGGLIDSTLDEPNSVVVRDIPIKVSARRNSGDPHDAFVHTAKLVVTMSDDDRDTLENTVCFIRKPEMVVQTVGREFEGRIYHAFLLAGAAIHPDTPSTDDIRADDFLRFAEPPAHDRWIPGAGRGQISQANLTARYVAPWLPNLKSIGDEVLKALFDLFDTVPTSDEKGPEAIFRNLRFLQGEAGIGGAGGALRRPEIRVTDWKVVEDCWNVTFELRARNRPEGWSVEPHLCLVGLDGRGDRVEWQELDVLSGGVVDDDDIKLYPARRGRTLTAVIRGKSGPNLPIPAAESSVDVLIGRCSPLVGPMGVAE